MAHEPICRENYKRWLVNGVHGYLQIGFFLPLYLLSKKFKCYRVK